MKRFVKHFYSWGCFGDKPIEEMITEYAEDNKLKIITITAMYQNGMYVLFEESEVTEE